MSDRPQNKHLKRGGSPGRPKGARSERSKTIEAMARAFLEGREYQASLKKRLISGASPQVEILLYHYAYGKPVDRLELVGPFVKAIEALTQKSGMTVDEVMAEAEAIAAGLG